VVARPEPLPGGGAPAPSNIASGGGKRLVAYVVRRAGSGAAAPAPSELRAFLRARLPEPLVPAAFVTLDALPLTANGKVDRRALPEPERAGAGLDVVAPRTATEAALAGLVAAVLAVDRVGVEDSFFDLGGHSLLGVRLLSAVRSRLGVELPLRLLFESPTVAGMAAAIDDLRLRRQGGSPGGPPGSAATGPAPPPPVEATPRGPRPPASFAQQRLWFVERLSPGAVFNVPMPLRLTGDLDHPALAAALAELTRRHEALRTVLPSGGGEVWQQVMPAPPPGAAPLCRVDLAALPAARREREALRLGEAGMELPFDLARGPLLRTALVRLDAREHILLAVLHHAIADGESLAILQRELVALYGAFAARRPSPLAGLPVQYADYALWQRRWLRGEALAGLLAAWRARFGSEVPPLALPTDLPRPASPSLRGDVRERVLAPEAAAGARSLAMQAGATLFMALLAAFQALLHRLSDQDVVAVGTPVSGRNRSEIEGVVGMFVNTLVLPVDCAGDPGFDAFLARVRDAALAAYACQDLPFEKLVEALRPERGGGGASPLFNVMFALHHDVPAAPSAAGLRFSPLALGNATSQFDLTLYVEERAGILIAAAEYSTELFAAATMDRLLAAYEALLGAAASRPRTPLSALPVPAVFQAAETAAAAAAMTAAAAAQAATTPAAGAAPPVPPAASPPAASPPAASPPATSPPVASPGGGRDSDPAARRERLQARRAQLSPEQRQLLERRLRGDADEAAAAALAAGGPRVLAQFAAGVAGRAPLFCVHPAGGDALCFVPLARHLGPDQPFYALQSRGLAPGEAPLATIEEMAALYVAEMRRVQPAGPYLIAGWSFGGIAAFEMARQLEAGGEQTALLAVIDTGPLDGGLAGGQPAAADAEPTAADPDGHGDDSVPPAEVGTAGAAGADAGAPVPLAGLLLDMSRYARGLWNKDLGLSAEALAGLDEERQLDLFVSRARAAGLAHHGDSLEQLRRVVAVFRANVRAFRAYVPRPYGGRITLFRAMPPAAAAAAAPAAGDAPPASPDLGWGRVGAAAVACHEVPGDHVTLLAEPHVRVLARQLRAAIDGALVPTGKADP